MIKTLDSLPLKEGRVYLSKDDIDEATYYIYAGNAPMNSNEEKNKYPEVIECDNFSIGLELFMEMYHDLKNR